MEESRHPLEGHFESFSSWARFAALRMRLDAIAPVAWSAQTLEALAAAEADPSDYAMAEMALSLSIAEWRRSPSRAEAACELSKFLALPTPEAADGKWHLICPLTGVGVVGAGFERAPQRAEAPATALADLYEGEDPKQSAWAKPSDLRKRAAAKTYNAQAGSPREILFAGTAIARAIAMKDKPLSSEILPVAAAAKRLMERVTSTGTFNELGKVVHKRLMGAAGDLAERLAKIGQDLHLGNGARHEIMGPQRLRAILEHVERRRKSPLVDLAFSRDEDGNLFLDKLRHVMEKRSLPESWIGANPPQEVQTLRGWAEEAGARALDNIHFVKRLDSRGRQRMHSPSQQAPRAGGSDGPEASLRGDEMDKLLHDILVSAFAPAVGLEISHGQCQFELLERFQIMLHSIRMKDGLSRDDREGLRDLMDVGMATEIISQSTRVINDLLRRGSVSTMPFACPAEKAKALPSLAVLELLPKELSLDAALVASDREARWLELQGFPEEAAEMRLEQVGATAQALSLSESRKLAASASATNEAKIMAMMAVLDDGWAAEDVRSRLAGFGIGAKQLSLFAEAPQGRGFMACLGALVEINAGGIALATRGDKGLNAAIALLLAFNSDIQIPAKTPHWREPLAEGQAMGLAKMVFDNPRSLADQIERLGMNASWRGAWDVFGSLPTADGLAYLSARANEVGRQAGLFARHGIDELAGRMPVEKAPAMPEYEFRFNGDAFDQLPFPWVGDELAVGWGKMAIVAGDGSILESDGFARGLAKAEAFGISKTPRAKPRGFAGETLALNDPARVILAEEGFVGRLALAAASALRTPPGLDRGAPARSQANAWLAEGKAAAKDWLGLSSGGARLAQGHSISEEKLLAFCDARAARERKAVAKGIPLPVHDARDREGRRWAELLGEAASRGVTAEAAATAALAFKPGEFGSGDLEIDYATSIGGCAQLMRGGVPLGEAIASLGRELESSQAIRARWQGAMLSRAQDMLAADAATEPKKRTSRAARAETRASVALRSELSGIQDWARDRAGRFYAALPAKLDWGSLAAGSRQWHEEVQAASLATSGSAAWDPIGLSWTSADGVWAARELVSAASLSEEGAAMHHCVGSYSQNCVNGGSRIISILKNGERSSTLELSTTAFASSGALPRVAHAWTIQQNKAHCNKDPEPGAAAAAKKIQASAIAASADGAARAKAEQELARKKRQDSAAKSGHLAKGFGDLELPGFDAAAALAKRAAARADGSGGQDPAPRASGGFD